MYRAVARAAFARFCTTGQTGARSRRDASAHLRAYLAVGGAMLACAPALALGAGDADGGAPARLSADASSAIIEAAAATQAHLDDVQASFAVTVHVEHAALASAGADWASPVLGRVSSVTGRIDWFRDAVGRRERVDYRFDLPRNLAVDYFTERSILDDGLVQVEVFPPSHQALVTPSRTLATWPAPADFLLPSGRRDFAALAREGVELEVYAAGERDFIIRYRPNPGDEAFVVEATLSGDRDFAVTGWRCPGCGIAVTVDYQRDDAGVLRPARVTYERGATLASPPAVRWVLEAERFERLSDTSVFDGLLRPGMFVTDYTRGKSATEPAALRVDTEGRLVPVSRTAKVVRASTFQSAYVAGVAALLVLAALAFRLRQADRAGA
jgi:hypothetical protein